MIKISSRQRHWGAVEEEEEEEFIFRILHNEEWLEQPLVNTG